MGKKEESMLTTNDENGARDGSKMLSVLRLFIGALCMPCGWTPDLDRVCFQTSRIGQPWQSCTCWISTERGQPTDTRLRSPTRVRCAARTLWPPGRLCLADERPTRNFAE